METWTRAADPSARRAPSAAGSVAETLTTSRSPGSSTSVRSENVPWVTVLLLTLGDHQPDPVAGRTPCLLRGGGLEARRQLERERVHAGTSTSRAR